MYRYSLLCLTVRASQEQNHEHGPHGEVVDVVVGRIHPPNGVAHQRVGQRVDSHHDSVEEAVARKPT